MQIEITDRLPAELEEIAQHSPEATFYQSSLWMDSLCRAFDAFAPGCVIARDGKRTLGYLPFVTIRRAFGRQLWSMPFGTYGGPVARGSAETARALAENYAAMRRGRGVLELGLIDFAGTVPVAGLQFTEGSTHVVRLPADFADLWSRFEKSKRRQARKARRDGIVVRETTDPDRLKRYHDIYVERCRAWRQSLVYPLALFEALFDRGAGGAVRLFLAEDGDDIVGGHINLYFRDTVIAWNGVTTEDSRASQASTLLYSECLRHACENGFRTYNLGASLGKDSLQDYKEALGGEPVPFRTGRWRSLRGRVLAALARRARG